MTTRALILVHDPAPGRSDRIPGALLPALARRGVSPTVTSLVREDPPDPGDYDLLVVMGSKEAAYDDTVPWLARERALVDAAIGRGMAVLGVCFGGQLLARQLGGSVGPAAHGEFGYTEVATTDPALVPPGPWMQFHGDAFVPPPGTEVARNSAGSQAFVSGRVVGLQFHPETTVDSFESWVERWEAESEVTRCDIDGLRADIAAHEQETTRLCEQLVDTFCSRYLG